MTEDTEADIVEVKPESGLSRFVKGIGRAAIREATDPARAKRDPDAWWRRQPRRRETQSVPRPSPEAGVRRLRKHAQGHGLDPAIVVMCGCKGCQCPRWAIRDHRCHPCSVGRHGRSGLGKARRRALAQHAVPARARRVGR